MLFILTKQTVPANGQVYNYLESAPPPWCAHEFTVADVLVAW